MTKLERELQSLFRQNRAGERRFSGLQPLRAGRLAIVDEGELLDPGGLGDLRRVDRGGMAVAGTGFVSGPHGRIVDEEVRALRNLREVRLVARIPRKRDDRAGLLVLEAVRQPRYAVLRARHSHL